MVNQKREEIESNGSPQVKHAVQLFGKERVLLSPDCGFATLADSPVSSAVIAEQGFMSSPNLGIGCDSPAEYRQ